MSRLRFNNSSVRWLTALLQHQPLQKGRPQNYQERIGVLCSVHSQALHWSINKCNRNRRRSRALHRVPGTPPSHSRALDFFSLTLPKYNAEISHRDMLAHMYQAQFAYVSSSNLPQYHPFNWLPRVRCDTAIHSRESSITKSTNSHYLMIRTNSTLPIPKVKHQHLVRRARK